MAPVATEPTRTSYDNVKSLKADADEKIFNPFYSPSIGDDGDDSYEYTRYKVSY